MAEFNQVIKQASRMCKACGDCDDCPLRDLVEEFVECPFFAGQLDAAAIEETVTKWAEEHPEPRYPSLNEAWKQLFPDMAEKNPPCYRYFISSDRLDEFCPGMRCETCRNQPIFADIAKKLGIKPIKEGT